MSDCRNVKTVVWLVVCFQMLIFFYSCKSKEDKKNDFFEKGKSYFDQQNYNSAEIEFKNAIELDPKFAKAHELLGQTYFKLENAKSALREYLIVESLEPDNVDVRLMLATIFMIGKRVKESQERIDYILNKNPHHLDALSLQAELLNMEGKTDEASAILDKIINADPKRINAYLRLAKIRTMEKKFAEAESLLNQARQFDPKDINISESLFQLYLAMKDFPRAEAEIQKAIEANPSNLELYISLGNYYETIAKDPQKAEASYLKAIQLEPKNVRPYMAVGRYYENLNNKDKALEMYQKALDLQPENAETVYTIARSYLQANQPDVAESYIDKGLEKKGQDFNLRMLKGELLLRKQDVVKASEIFDKLVSEDPKSVIAHYFKALSRYRKGELKAAKASLEKALEMNSDFINAKLLLAEIHLKENYFDLAEKKAKEIISSVPANSPEQDQAKFLLANACLYQKKYAEAKEVFDSLIKQHPNNPELYQRMGLLHRLKKELKPAMENYEKALSLAPNHIDVFSDIIFLHIFQKEYDAAIRKCDRQLEKVKDSPQLSAIVYDLKGKTLFSQGKQAEAEAFFLEALKLFPEMTTPYYSLARIYLDRKDDEKAIAQYETLLQKNPNNPGPHMFLGLIYDMKKKSDLSEKHYREALKINPDFIPAANNLAYLLADHNKDLDEALELAKKAKEKFPNDPMIMDTLGWVYYQKTLYDNAAYEFNASINKNPDSAIGQYHLGLALFQKGDKNGAKNALEKALSLNPQFDGADKAKKLLSELK